MVASMLLRNEPVSKVDAILDKGMKIMKGKHS